MPGPQPPDRPPPDPSAPTTIPLELGTFDVLSASHNPKYHVYDGEIVLTIDTKGAETAILSILDTLTTPVEVAGNVGNNLFIPLGGANVATPNTYATSFTAAGLYRFDIRGLVSITLNCDAEAAQCGLTLR